MVVWSMQMPESFLGKHGALPATYTTIEKDWTKYELERGSQYRDEEK